ncbi:MAG: thioredoxin [Clostridiaceae bacterium]|nr:thioredoxin [Clostridiaceae bacterium]
MDIRSVDVVTAGNGHKHKLRRLVLPLILVLVLTLSACQSDPKAPPTSTKPAETTSVGVGGSSSTDNGSGGAGLSAADLELINGLEEITEWRKEGNVLLRYVDGRVKHYRIIDLRALLEGLEAPVFIDFWAEWCGFCIAAEPFVDGLVESHRDRLLVIKVNTDLAGTEAAMFGVDGLPSFKIVHDVTIVGEFTGFNKNHPEAYIEYIDAVIDHVTK